jgi:alcohol dehydrogenase (cytochrome c)
MLRRLAAATVAAIALCAGGAMANEELLRLQRDPNQWVMPNGNYASQRYSELNQINRDNVRNLRPVWSFSTGVLRGHEGGPLVIGEVMFIHTPFPNRVFALDLNNPGRVLWRYEPTQDPNVIGVMCCDTVNRGPAYADGKIILSQADTTLVALDARTGQEIWKLRNGDPSKGETSTMAPMVFGDKVLVGISGGEYGVRGHVTAYNLRDGSMAWRAYSVGTDEEIKFNPQRTTHLGQPVGENSSLRTWEGDQWRLGGGTTWGWFSYDPQLNLIYYGSGNPGTWNPSQRPGDNRWSMTIFARDANTGEARWVYQMTPHDEWDYDGVNEMILVDNLDVRGQRVARALVHFDRNGFAYTMDRENGRLLLAEKFDPAVNWASHVDMETGRPQVVREFSTRAGGEDTNVQNICPAALGTKDQQPAAYSPRNNLFFVPTNHVCMDYEPFRVSYTAGQPFIGATLSMYPPRGSQHMGNFIAFDAGQGRIVWSRPERFSVWSGALATAGDIAFYGTLEGHLKAVDMRDGRELYSFRTPSGIIGNVNTFTHRGKQYIAVLSGVGGWAGIGMAAGLSGESEGLGAVGAYRSLSDYTQLGGVLTVFALPD